MAKGNRFVVDLGGLKLKPEDQKGVAASIQGAVLSYLAQKYNIPIENVKLTDDAGILGMYVPDDPKKP